ncbi:Lactonase, 7-bladed beta-propeller-domain-containing protein [Suillus clintonianus]|uniref:Lactonase, 7-bladed beta-propeller-domain-containing protein n=1 Tax=Suillus clintonianus TaxID=1904413 RepID=UPI001B862130|nr:Lactonase, 7-bladed beta-propeller-domain-containing protein [Suillus clintonianus]KAG2121770.1 Lactonase, 7-bladed beta-propeller-domain-containing protein [Suillus clintonianus]
MAPLTILVASYTDSIYTLSFDPTPPTGSPTLDLLARTPVGYRPSWIASHPSDKSLIYTGLEQTDGEVVAIKYGSGGTVEGGDVVARAKSGGADPCTLLVTEDELIIGNYNSGTIATLPISTSAPYILSPNPWTLSMPFEHVGRNKARQSSSHPHQIIFNPLNQKEKELLIPDLGVDKVWRLTKRSDGKWSICGHIDFGAGGGPRHIAARGTTLYTLLELTSKLAVHAFPPLPASPTHLTSIFTLSAPLPVPDNMIAAEILLPEPNASFPGTFIYTSNRNDPNPEGDTIAIFSLAAGEGQPELVNEVRTGLNHVRGMEFGGEDDKYLVVGGVEGGGVKVFERIDGGKGLEEIAKLSADVVGCPTGFLWY